MVKPERMHIVAELMENESQGATSFPRGPRGNVRYTDLQRAPFTWPHRCFVVCVSVCAFLLDMTMNCAKTSEPIEMPFGVWTRVVARIPPVER